LTDGSPLLGCRLETIALGLDLRFGERGIVLLPRVRDAAEIDRLHRLVEALRSVKSLEEFEGLIGGRGP